MPEVNKAAEPMPPGAFYSLMGGELGVPRIRSGEDLALLVVTGVSGSPALKVSTV